MAAFVMPGQAEGSITVPLGYGRTAAGSVGSGVGFDAYPLRTTDAMHIARGVRVTATGRRYVIATTQDHHAIDAVGMRGRDQRLGQLVREGTLAQYLKDPDFAGRLGPEHPPLRSLWQEHPYEDRKWGMTVDLSACTGCSACVVACQAENNIPVVGKEQVKNGREMHWIRVDRYFTGSPESPRVAHQPLMCHHCENAPCEQVCPVAATMHDAEGLNVMVYNRCVGVRYCSNNCPYKVRRFNFFNYQKDVPATKAMVHNPDVTVRSRGVMEKCTFCVQRIKAVTIGARNEGRPVRDGEIVPACAQACPTQAIVFGDLNDPESRVRKLAEHKRAYAMLEELNVKPRTRYLARLTNPEAALGAPDGAGRRHG
jgi:molybdopterin-containing oxidoreductase family iron-sulfur binding subunit